MKYLIQRYFVIGLVAFSCVSLMVAYYMQINVEYVLLFVSVVSFVLAYWLEKKMPFRQSWRRNAGDLKIDLTSALVIIGIVEPLIKALLPMLSLVLLQSLYIPHNEVVMPFYAQVFIVALMIEFSKYWVHRLHHRYKSLWWLHAMHHSSERLYFINNLRLHPLNYLLSSVISFTPVLLLNFSSDAILAYLVLTQPIVLLQHCNVDLKSGWVNYVFNTNEVHRWHHSKEPKEAQYNYANVFMIWDQIFQTFKGPSAFTAEKQVGLFSLNTSYPAKESYWIQITSMFRSPCCTT